MLEFRVEEDRSRLQGLARALAAESDGKKLKRDLGRRLRAIMRPLREEAVTRLMQTGGTSVHAGPSLRQAIAKQTRAGVRFSGRNVGVNLVQRARGMPRGFRMAGRAFNREEGWSPKSLGGTVVHQHATPTQWFDEPTKGTKRKARREVNQALEDMARRIADRGR